MVMRRIVHREHHIAHPNRLGLTQLDERHEEKEG